MFKKILIGVSALAVLAVFAAPSAQAKFPEKNITFLIPYGPGGGFDTITRKLSPFIAKHLGGKVHVIPKNMTGGRGKKAATYLTKSKPNGYRIMIFNLPGHALPTIKGDKNAGYDIRKFTWLARIAKGSYVVVVSGKSKFKTIKDLVALNRPVKHPELGPGGTSYIMSTIMWNTLGKKVKFIPGYKSSSNYSLAVMRGDGDVTMLAVGSFRKYIGGKMKKKKNIGPRDLRPVLHLTLKKSEFGVQNAADAGYPELAKMGLERMVAGPPNLPKDVRRTLERALKKAILDPEFVAWAKKVGRGPIAHLGGKDAAKSIDNLIKLYSKYKSAL